MTRGVWRDDVREGSAVARSIGWRAAVWVLGILALVVVTGAVWWGIKVATSDVKGQGDALQTKNSGTNRIRAQEEFVQTYQDVLAADQRVDVMWNAAQTNPATVNTTNYTGAVNFCIQAVADYNALSDKYTSADFRPADLPEQIDSLDPTTDCKENHS